MYGLTDGTMSVNAPMATINFPTFLRDRMSNQTALPCPGYRTRPQHSLPLQTSTHWQTSYGAYYGAWDRRPPSQNPDTRAAYLVPPHTMSGTGHFKDHVRDPDHVYLSGNFPPAPSAFRHDIPAFSPFMPAAPYHYYVPKLSPNAPLKLENSPQLPVPSVLSGEVDTSKYENLSYNDWYTAPPLYNSSSPSSSAYHADSPATPSDTFSNYPYNFHPELDMQTPKQPPLGFQPGSQGVQSADFPPTLAPSAVAQPMRYEIPHGLPATSHNPSMSAHGYFAPHQFHHYDHIQGSSPTQEDFDSEAQSEVDNDMDDEESSETASSGRYRLAGDETEARDRRDELLLSMREEGHSYREIKRMGKFREAESTLRGRHRTLTKDKEDRVRKPQWTDEDEFLLSRAVRHYTRGSNESSSVRRGRCKLPWKKISQRMKDHGSSYLFAPATCAKKWDSLNR